MFGSSGKKIKLEDELYQKLEVAAKTLGCSVDEFVMTTLTREVEKTIFSTGSSEMSAKEVADIENSLKGLGYLE